MHTTVKKNPIVIINDVDTAIECNVLIPSLIRQKCDLDFKEVGNLEVRFSLKEGYEGTIRSYQQGPKFPILL